MTTTEYVTRAELSAAAEGILTNFIKLQSTNEDMRQEFFRCIAAQSDDHVQRLHDAHENWHREAAEGAANAADENRRRYEEQASQHERSLVLHERSLVLQERSLVLQERQVKALKTIADVLKR